MDAEHLCLSHRTDISREQRHFHLMMKKTQIDFRLVNALRLRELGCCVETLPPYQFAKDRRTIPCAR